MIVDRAEAEILNKTDEELMAEIRRRGEDPDEIAQRMAKIVHDAIQSWKRGKLQ